MMLSRWNQQEPNRAFERFNRMMEEVFGGTDRPFPKTWIPSVDIKETEDELTFVAELPGLEEKDVRVEMVGDLLTIRGERELKREEEKENYVRIEREYGGFLRSFPLDSTVKASEIKATFKDGLLTVRVPKSEDVPRRTIPVSNG